MRPRVTIASGLFASGVLMIGFSVLQVLTGRASLAATAVSLVGIIALFVGLVLFATALLENWLSSSQRVLVDGLQAG